MASNGNTGQHTHPRGLTSDGGTDRHARLIAGVAATALALATACGPGADDQSGRGSGSGDARVEVVVMAASSLFDAVAAVDRYFHSELSSAGITTGSGTEAMPSHWPDVVPVTAGSSTLVAQLAAGAEADVLITADVATMRRAQGDGSVQGIPVAVGVNHLVLATAPGNPGGITELADLAHADLLIGLCATAVPCGALARRVLDAADISAAPDTLELSVRVLAGKIKLGELDGGLIYATDALALGLPTVNEPVLDTHVNKYLMASVEANPSKATEAVLNAFRPGGPGAIALRQLGFSPPP